MKQYKVAGKMRKEYKEGRTTELKAIGNALSALADIVSDAECEMLIRPLVVKLIERLSNIVSPM